MNASPAGSKGPSQGAVVGIAAGAVALAILHQDFWWWDTDYAVFGFLPVGLGYHVLYSLMAAALWACACAFAWPRVLEEDDPGAGAAGPADGGEGASS